MIALLLLGACGSDPIAGKWEGTYRCEDSIGPYFDVEGFAEIEDETLSGPFYFGGYLYNSYFEDGIFTSSAGTLRFRPQADAEGRYDVAFENCIDMVGQFEDYELTCYTAPPGGALLEGRRLSWEVCWDEDSALVPCDEDVTSRCELALDRYGL